jgi:hypothetical protein
MYAAARAVKIGKGSKVLQTEALIDLVIEPQPLTAL